MVINNYIIQDYLSKTFTHGDLAICVDLLFKLLL